jgi:hypothetical protein
LPQEHVEKEVVLTERIDFDNLPYAGYGAPPSQRTGAMDHSRRPLDSSVGNAASPDRPASSPGSDALGRQSLRPTHHVLVFLSSSISTAWE